MCSKLSPTSDLQETPLAIAPKTKLPHFVWGLPLLLMGLYLCICSSRSPKILFNRHCQLGPTCHPQSSTHRTYVVSMDLRESKASCCVHGKESEEGVAAAVQRFDGNRRLRGRGRSHGGSMATGAHGVGDGVTSALSLVLTPWPSGA